MNELYERAQEQVELFPSVVCGTRAGRGSRGKGRRPSEATGWSVCVLEVCGGGCVGDPVQKCAVCCAGVSRGRGALRVLAACFDVHVDGCAAVDVCVWLWSMCVCSLCRVGQVVCRMLCRCWDVCDTLSASA